MTRAFANDKLALCPEAFKKEVRERLIRHYLSFVEQHAKRPRPVEAYWNALVTDRMLNIDPEWPNIREAMITADRDGFDQLLLNLVMFLVHYMDSRFITWIACSL